MRSRSERGRRDHPRPWHKPGKFGDGPRIPMCRERRATWKARLHLHKRAKRVTAEHQNIGHAMLKRLSMTGRLDPSHATLAHDVGCSVSTVQRALSRFEKLGMVWWAQRLVRAGWRVEQTSNAYVLTLGAPVAIPPNPAFRTGGQTERETSPIDKSIGSSFACPPDTAEHRAATEALARRRAVAEARLLNTVSQPL